MPNKLLDAHYPNPWIGRVIVGGLTVLVLGLLAFAALKPDETGRRNAEGAADTAQMDAAQQRADTAREAGRTRPLVP